MSEEYKAKGNAAFAAKNFEEAITWFTKGIELDEKNHVLYSNRSACYASLHQYQKALEDAKLCVDCKPDWAKGYARLGAAFFGCRQYTEAASAYEKGLNYDPSMESLKTGLSQALQAKAAPPHPLAQIFSPQIIAMLATSHNPTLISLREDKEFMGILTRVIGDQSLIQQYLQDPRMMKLLSVVLRQPGDDEDVVPPPPKKERAPEPEPEKALMPEEIEAQNKHKEAEAIKQKGNDAYKAKKFDEALKFYNEALVIQPKNIQYMNNIAAVFFEQGEYVKCREQCDKAVEVGRETLADFKDIAKAITRKATAYQKEKDYESAIKCFRESLLEHRTGDTLTKLNKCEAEAKKAADDAYFSDELSEKARVEGNEKFKEQQYAEAVQLYSEAIKRNPKSHAALSNRAAAYMKLGAYDDAEKDCQSCLKLEPTFVKAVTRLAHIYFFRKEYHKALVEYQKGLSMEPANEECKNGITRTVQKIQESSSEGDEERARRAMGDPEIQSILTDTYMRQVLNELSEDPKNLQRYMKAPDIMAKINKLIAAGIIRTA